MVTQIIRRFLCPVIWPRRTNFPSFPLVSERTVQHMEPAAKRARVDPISETEITYLKSMLTLRAKLRAKELWKQLRVYVRQTLRSLRSLQSGPLTQRPWSAELHPRITRERLVGSRISHIRTMFATGQIQQRGRFPGFGEIDSRDSENSPLLENSWLAYRR